MKYYRYLLSSFFLLISFISSAEKIVHNEKAFEVRVAVVDIQSILEKSVALQQIRDSIDKFNQQIHEDKKIKEDKFKILEEELVKQRETLAEEIFAQKVNSFNKKVSDAQKEIQEKKTKLEQAHGEAVGKVHEVTINIITSLAKKHNLNLVLPSTQILYAHSNLNITEEVINLLNNKLKSVKVNYP